MVAIPVYCTNCNRQFSVADSMEGKQGKCPGCQILLQFPLRPNPAPQPPVAQPPSFPANAPKPKSPLQAQKPPGQEKTASQTGRQKRRSLPQAQPISQSTTPAMTRPPQPESPQAVPPPDAKPTSPTNRPVSASGVPIARTIAVGEKAKAYTTPQTAGAPPAQTTRSPTSRQPQGPVATAPTPGLLDVAVQSQARQPSRQELQASILRGLEGRIDDVELTSDYRFGTFLVVSAMIAMVAIYLLLVVGAGAFIVWYVMYGFHAIQNTEGSGEGVFFSVLYFIPLCVAVLTFFALVRPLFGRFDRDERIRTLTRQSDPLLYAFVERVAVAVGAPMPARINVDTDVNASAGFQGGLFNPSRNELVLTLGLSLIVGLNTRQFAGVLAHELGHFTQKSSIRMTALVIRISTWFSQAADPDYWDDMFAKTARSTGGRFFLLVYLIRMAMKVPQWTFRGLLMLTYLVCGYMFRQREFDADRFETRVGGSACFESTTRRLEVLGVAYRGAIDDLQYGHGEGRLGDNLPLLVLSNAKQLPTKVHKALRKHVEESKTGLFDSHPCPRERIENAWREKTPGIYRVELPAHLLFSNFLGLARNATWDFYRGIFGPKFKQSDMHPIGDLLERIEQEEQAYKTLRRYYQGTFSVLRPIRLRGSSVDAPADVGSTVTALKNARQTVMATAEAHRNVVKRYDQADTLVIEATQARALFRAGFRVRKNDFSVPMRNVDQANDVSRQANARMNSACRELVQYEEAFSIRLWTALQLMHVEKVAARLENAQKLHEECHRLVDALAFLNGKSDDLLQLRNTHAALRSLFMQLRGHERDQELIREILRETKDVFERLARLRQSLAMVMYPFDHAKGNITMAEYALEEMPNRENPFHIYEAAEQFGMAMSAFYPRLAGRLAIMAEKVENLIGLTPLPEPPEEEEDEESNE